MTYYDKLENFSCDDNEYEELCLKYGKARVDREIDLELESRENAYNSFMSKRNKAIQDGTIGTIGTTKTLISEAIPAMIKGLEKWYDKVNTGKPGKRHVLAGVLKDLTLEEVAFITVKTLISHGATNPTQTKMAGLIGEFIEDEIRYKLVLSMMDKKEVTRFQNGLNKRVSFLFKKRFVQHRENIMADGGLLKKWEKLSLANRIQLGIKLIDIFIVSTGLGYLEKGFSSNSKRVVYNFGIDPVILQYLDENDKDLASMMFDYRPMVIPPKPWEAPEDGGYYLNLHKPVPLVRVSRKVLHKLYGDIDMPNVYKAVNAIQATPWRINNRVLEVANEVCSWVNIPEALGLPSDTPAEKPERPVEADTNPEVHKEWKASCVHYYQEDNKRKSKRYLLNSVLTLANTYKDDEEIYFPHNLDFRGRVYPMTTLSPQGNDFTKSLLEFAEGKPLGESGHTWLAIQGANCYGLDKKPIEERLEWVYSNAEFITAIAENPLDNLSWTETDSPWEFLAFCFEWNDYLKYGSEYVSHIPVALDGSCSGLQHFSAMLRDPVGGEAVNLVPSEEVQDIYRIVADKVNEKLKEHYKNGTEDEITKDENGADYLKKGTRSLASEWIKHGVTRFTTKRSTMTLCYGSSRYGFAEQVLQDSVYPALSKDPTAFSRPAQSSRYMAGLIWEALGGVVVKAVEAMDWLQTASSLLAKEKDMNGKALPTFWMTPAGFPVLQKYNKFVYKQLRTFTTGNITIKEPFKEDTVLPEGTMMGPSYKQKLPDLDVRKQKQGIAPNFIHSMDASHLMLTVCSCVDKGVSEFAMIHDSYGVPAGEAEIMFNTVRDVFVSTYTENDVLQDLHDHVHNLLSEKAVEQLPEPPSKGDLDLDCVKESLYAFC